MKVEGPTQDIGVQVAATKDGEYRVTYKPTVAGAYKVHVTVGDEHIPGSIFNVLVLESESLGGEGKIRVYFSTTSSSEKAKRDVFSLETLLTVHQSISCAGACFSVLFFFP